MPTLDSPRNVTTADAPAGAGSDYALALTTLVDGTVGGFVDSAKHVLEPKTLATVGLGVATGYGLRTMQLYEGLRPTGWLIGAALTYGFVADVVPNLKDSWNAFFDVAHDPTKAKQSQAVFAKSLGGLAFDGALFGLSGKLGGKFADSNLIGEGLPFTRIPTLRDSLPLRENAVYKQSDPLVDLFNNASDSVVSIRKVVDLPGGSRTVTTAIGTGVFGTADGAVVTNAHVVDSIGERLAIQTNKGETFLVKAHVMDHANDLAVLQPYFELPGKTFPAAQFAQAEPAVGETVAAIGFPLNETWRARYLSPGKFGGQSSNVALVRDPVDPQLPFRRNIVGLSDLPGTSYPLNDGMRMAVEFPQGNGPVSLTPAADGQFVARVGAELKLNMHGEPGNSGSPVFNTNKEVIGIVSKKIGNTQIEAVPLNHVRNILDLARITPYERQPLP